MKYDRIGHTVFFHTVVVFSLSLLLFNCAQRTGSQPPNIIFILTDDQRWDAMGCAGNPVVQTPNIDQLASDGMRFENAFVTTSICMASRGSVMTGLYERTHGWRDCGTAMDREIWEKFAYPVLLKQAGYYTGFVGKFDVDIEQRGWTDPEYGKNYFDVYKPFYFRPVHFEVDGVKKHRDDLEAEAAFDFLKSVPSDKPFCLSLWTNSPHSDHIAPDRHYAKYADEQMPQPQLSDQKFIDTQPEFIYTSMNRERWHGHFGTPERYQETVKNYYGQVSSVDETLGRIRRTLEDLDKDQNTVIIFASDNGYFLGDRGLAGKWLMHEQSLRIPLIIHDPRLRAKESARTLKQMALNIDISPTILNLAGIDAPEDMHGKSLLPLLKNKNVDWRNDFFYEHRRDCPERLSQVQSEGVRTENWKYIRYLEQSNYEELYDLANDPKETKNLAEHPSFQQQLSGLRNRCNQFTLMYSRN